MSTAAGKTTTRLPQPTTTNLQDMWLALAWVGWSILTIVSLINFVTSIYDYLSVVQTPCKAGACVPGQPTPEAVQTLHQLGLSVGAYATFGVGLVLSEGLAACVLCAVILRRRPADWMALLVTSTFITQALFENNYFQGLFDNTASPWHAVSLGLSFISPVQFLFLVALFPTGRMVPHWMIWLLVGMCLIDLPPSLFPAMSFGTVIETLFVVSAFPLAAGSMIYRYRRVSTPVERQQTKWVVFGVILALVGFIVWWMPQIIMFSSLSEPGSLYDLIGHPLFVISTLSIPICFGIAILRYRLWDIDVIINRTLVYGSLTAILAAIYFGSVIAMQQLTRAITGQQAENNPLVIVLSTLLIAALFTPLRRRVQATIDRRFYRAKYDSARTLERFAATLRSETDLRALNDHLVGVVDETMRPAHVSLWLRPVPREGAR